MQTVPITRYLRYYRITIEILYLRSISTGIGIEISDIKVSVSSYRYRKKWYRRSLPERKGRYFLLHSIFTALESTNRELLKKGLGRIKRRLVYGSAMYLNHYLVGKSWHQQGEQLSFTYLTKDNLRNLIFDVILMKLLPYV